MCLDGRPRVRVELAVEVCRDVSAGTPAAERLGEARQASLIALGEGAHQHHPSPSQALLRRRKPGVHRAADLHGGPPDDIVEDDRNPVDDREARQRILELVAELRPLEHALGCDGVVVVPPVRLDGVDVELFAMDAGPIDDPVDEAPPEPGGERRRVAELVAAAPGAHDRLLGTVLRLVRVTDQAGREPDQSGQLRDQLFGERVGGGAVPWCRCDRVVVHGHAAVPGAEILLGGAADGYANIHGPNERVLLDELERTTLAIADLLGRLAASGGGAA